MLQHLGVDLRTHLNQGCMESAAVAALARRWEAAESARLAQLEAVAARAADLLAAVHYSRSLALRCGLAPWRALLHSAQQQAAAAYALRRRSLAAAALAAFQRCRHAAVWRTVMAEACAAAGARRLHQHALLRRGLAALCRHAQWVRTDLPALHAARLRAAAWHSWRQLAAATAQQARLRCARAAAHCHRGLLRRALRAWQRGASACKKERLVEQRRQQRWTTVERYLAEHRAAKSAGAAGGAAEAGAQRHGGAWSGHRDGDGELLCGGCGPDGTPPSSAENSAWDPNTLFGGGPGLDF